MRWILIVTGVLLLLVGLLYLAGWAHMRELYPGASLRNMRFSADSATLYGSAQHFTPHDDDGRVFAWECSTGKLRWQGTTESAARESALSPDGATLVTTGFSSSLPRRGEIIAWDVHQGGRRWRVATDNTDPENPAFSSDGRRLLTLFSKEIRVFDPATGEQKATLPSDGKTTGTLSQLCVLPDDKGILVTATMYYGDDDAAKSQNNVQLWDAQTGALQRTYYASRANRAMADASPDGDSIVLAFFGERKLMLKRRSDGATIQTASLPAAPDIQVNGVRFASARHIEIICEWSRIGEIIRPVRYVWNRDTGLVTKEPTPYPTGGIVSPDGATAAVRNWGNGFSHPPLATLYNAVTGGKLRDSEGQAGW